MKKKQTTIEFAQVFDPQPNNEKINPTNIWFDNKLESNLIIHPHKNQCGAFVLEDHNNPSKRSLNVVMSCVLEK